jgi:hypothetical protein
MIGSLYWLKLAPWSRSRRGLTFARNCVECEVGDWSYGEGRQESVVSEL